ncbi:hypothetical protein BGZ70_004785 [Mortierella alpina]|uniref:BZIP domain-containing protein n=1 Tax=Mortierella alpina TaxID=64518 RepID=A0A9P6J9U3_MORAP|nr:hypothetical protein BGZ70_004785 [Mortierella alpina]
MAAIDTTTTSTGTSPEDESILSFLTTDFLESQTTSAATFDSAQFFDTLQDDHPLKYHDLLHPPSPPTSVGTFSESSGSPHHSNMDSCDEGSSSDVPMDSNPLEYWQYVYSDLDQSNAPFPILNDPAQQQQQQQLQPGAWPLLANVDSSLLQQPSSVVPNFGASGLFESSSSSSNSGAGEPNSPAPNNTSKTGNNSGKRSHGAGPSAPPSPVSSVKAEKKLKRAKKQAPAPSHPALLPLAPLKPLVSLAPQPTQPTPPSPPVSVHDTFIKQSPPLSPCIMPAPSVTSAGAGGPLARRPSIIPALTPSLARSNPVIVKSTLVPDEKPQSEAVMSAQAKRQERLIKNRAAALLSRKRKREHINLLESHTDMLKNDNQELRERVSELEENVKVLTLERDSARKECERLRQINGLTARPNLHSDTILMDMDLERNIRSVDAERGLNSKATGVVFMIILFSFALFNLPSGKLETLMVGGSLGRPRIGAGIVGRALDSYTKNPTISGQVRQPPTNQQDMNNMTDLVVFSDNRALQNWLGHEPVSNVKDSNEKAPRVGGTVAFDKETVQQPLATSSDESTKSVGFVGQTREQLAWVHSDTSEMNEPDRDAWLYCTNLLYSLRPSSVTKAAGTAQSTNGEIRRPRLSLISPLDGVESNGSKQNLPPWMPGAGSSENDAGQRYLRLDVEVTSSRVVSGKGLGDHEQVIRFPLMPVGVFDNSTTSLTPSKPAAPTPVAVEPESSSSSSSSSFVPGRRRSSQGRSSRVNVQGGVSKTRRIYEAKDQYFQSAQALRAAAVSAAAAAPECTEPSTPLAPIKEEPMEVYIKEEPMD